MPTAEVHVRWSHTDELRDAHVALLDERERERWQRYARGGDRDRFALGSALVRGLVAELDGTTPAYVELDRTCPRCGAQHGPVTTPGRGWRCSVAHSGPFAAAAVVAASAATHVGLDLETRCPPEWADLLPDVLGPDEGAPTDETAFLALWVRKEAVVKATGEGLSRPLSSFSISGTTSALRVSGVEPGLLLVDLDTTALPAGPDQSVAAALAVGADHLHLDWRRADS